jgi:release factor glutamine methyltransferase
VTADEDLRRREKILLAHVLGRRDALALDPDAPLEPSPRRRFEDLRARLRAGEPLQYLLGEWDFWGRTFRVDSRALIPRPETEHLVEEALARAPGARRVLDLGCGSGVLAITLALEMPGASVFGLDSSLEALALSRQNAGRLGARVHWLASLWTDAVEGAPFDLAVSNPPYVARRDAETLPREVRDHEPATALFAGEDGTSEIRRLLAGLPPRLAPGALFLCELGFGQRDEVVKLVGADPRWRLEDLVADLAGIPRVAVLRRIA